ncbi:hypothetical protein F5878DRAFT_201389 [Lentinula raphanica]|uniref:Uncharacterized protein n=1 Tax=Lentinula raphanica TaxID=153919 RepID=A0AA38UGW9_9AGAR|nr:hypothetical protein F5878DRAFT_201389 [Lentinula raphanica]
MLFIGCHLPPDHTIPYTSCYVNNIMGSRVLTLNTTARRPDSGKAIHTRDCHITGPSLKEVLRHRRHEHSVVKSITLDRTLEIYMKELPFIYWQVVRLLDIVRNIIYQLFDKTAQAALGEDIQTELLPSKSSMILVARRWAGEIPVCIALSLIIDSSITGYLYLLRDGLAVERVKTMSSMLVESERFVLPSVRRCRRCRR